MLQSLSVVIELFYQTLGVLSQDGLLRFIDIHACKQLFEIGGTDEVLYPNEKVLICSPFLSLFIIWFVYFSGLGLLFLYICSPNAGPLSFLFSWVWTSVFYSFYPSLTVSCLLFNTCSTSPQQQAKLILHVHVNKKCTLIPPPPFPSQNVFDLILFWDDCNTQEKLETMVLKITFWVNKVHYGLHVCENGEYKIINENNVNVVLMLMCNQPKCTLLLF